jgi:hypothetical protein
VKTYQVLILLACAAVAMPFVLATFGRDNYDASEGVSIDDWKRLWARLTGKGR